ncbi:MAG: glycosyltransferase family 4 protein [Planctomycetota bacterium]|jgi:glycosyltransferase involved in cell wall biosynthesis
MGVVVYAEEFGVPSQVWLWRQVRAARTPVVTHKYRRREVFPHEPVWEVPRRRALLDRAGAFVPALRQEHGFRMPPRTERDVIRRLEKGGATLLHAHFGPAGLRAMPVVRALGIPLVVTFHGYDITRLPAEDADYRRELEGLFRVARCIAVSEHVRQRLERLGCSDATVLPLGTPLRERIDRINALPVRVLTVARLVPLKGVPDLVEAVRAIDAEIELHVVGEGPDLANVEARRGDDLRIFIHGNQPPAEVARHLERADIFVLNSRRSKEGAVEGFPISVLEAMAAGLPVIGTRHGGIPESVQEGTTGLLVDECDTSALQRAIEELVRDPVLRRAMGDAGRKAVEDRYELGACTQRLLAFYEEVAHG